MEGNPYVAMLAAFEPQEGAPALVLGLVTAVSPLRVLCEGNTLEPDDLMCNAALLAGVTAEVEGKLTGNGSVGSGETGASGLANLTLSGVVKRLKVGFTVGDQLLMVPMEERQRYVIVCKVVGL